MELSIIIPVYNNEKTLETCLNCINGQKTGFSYEVIAVNDGSTDNSLQLLNKFKKKYKWLRVISQENQKQAAARNRGLKFANGKLVTFVDADDLMDPNYIQQMIQPFMSNDGLQWMICGIKKEFQKKEKIEVVENISVFRDASTGTKLKTVGSFLNRNKEMDAGLWNKIYVMKIINENELRFKNKNFYEDTLFNLEYYLHVDSKNILTTSSVLYTLNRVSGTSTTTSYDEQMDKLSESFFRTVDKIIHNVFGINNDVDRILETLRIRLTIHGIHYHLTTDDSWNSKRTLIAIKQSVELRKVFFYYNLSIKYRLSCIMLMIMPKMYKSWYLKRH